MTVLNQLLVVLLAWTLISMGAAHFGLHATSSERWKSFWLMSGLWGLIDGLIVLYAMLSEPLDDATFRQVLWINSGLDVAYIVTGILLSSRSRPRLQGFGNAIIIQGVFLLGLDVTFALKLS